MTPYNVPAFAMYRNAVAPPFKLEWERGERKMLIISIGAGSIPLLGPGARHPSRSIIEVAIGIAGELMNGMAYDQDINCRTVGRCIFGPPLDREVGNLVPDVPIEEDLGRDFLYARYDAELTREGLDDLGLARRMQKLLRRRRIWIHLSVRCSRYFLISLPTRRFSSSTGMVGKSAEIPERKATLLKFPTNVEDCSGKKASVNP